MHIRIASIMLVASILGLGAIAPVSMASAQSESIASAMGGAFASVKTEITDTQIVITIDRNPNAPPLPEGGEGNVTLPEGPIIIVPPDEETGEEGTVILPPVGNETVPEPEGNVTIVDPEGNVTQIEPPTNVTVIDNDTVVVAPPDQPVTETPGNVTVIDPPAAVPEPEPCSCPPVGVEGGAPDIQAPGANITMQNETTIIRPDTQPGEESGNGNGNGDGNGGG